MRCEERQHAFHVSLVCTTTSKDSLNAKIVQQIHSPVIEKEKLFAHRAQLVAALIQAAPNVPHVLPAHLLTAMTSVLHVLQAHSQQRKNKYLLQNQEILDQQRKIK